MLRPAIAADGRGDEAGLVQRVGVQRDLQAPLLRAPQRGVDRGRGRAPVLVDLVAAGPGERLLLERAGRDGVALAEQQQVDRERVERAVGLLEVPRPGRDGGGLRPLGRAGAAAAQRGQPGGQRLVDLRRREQVDVGVEAAGREDLALAGDHVGARADDQRGVDAVGDVGVAAAPDPDDPAGPDADVGADDAPVVEDDDVGDHRVERALGRGGERLVHRLADRLAAAEDRLLAADGQVLLDLDPQVGVAEADLVPGGRAEDRRVLVASDAHASALLLGRGGRTELQPGHEPAPAQRDDRDRPRGARLEAHRRAGRDVEAEPCAAARSNSSPAFTSGRWKCEPTWIGRSAVFVNVSSPRSSGPRSALSSISPGAIRKAPGPEVAMPAMSAPPGHWIGRLTGSARAG